VTDLLKTEIHAEREFLVKVLDRIEGKLDQKVQTFRTDSTFASNRWTAASIKSTSG
jgi:hypothetical protein